MRKTRSLLCCWTTVDVTRFATASATSSSSVGKLRRVSLKLMPWAAEPRNSRIATSHALAAATSSRNAPRDRVVPS